MNGFSRPGGSLLCIRRRMPFPQHLQSFVGLIAIVVVFNFTGCNPITRDEQVNNASESVGVEKTETKEPEGPSPEEILDNLQSTYLKAESYQDQATLYLNYRLHGQAMQEPQPWNISWNREGKLNARLFNARVTADGKTLSCYVFDIDSENLDDQYLLLPYDGQIPISQLYRDNIARHFLGGFSELPLDESDLTTLPKLIPPQLALLTERVTNPWLQAPEKLQRLDDQSIDGRRCHVIRSLAEGMTSDIWVDAENWSLVQMSLPLKLLAGKVIRSSEVSEVELIARFHDQKFNPTLPEDLFWIEERPSSKLVRKFVAVPEVFPSELIGQTAPEFQLNVNNGRARTRVFFQGKITALLWLAGDASLNHLDDLNAIASKYDHDQFHLAAVYSDSELADPSSGSTAPTARWQDKISKVQIPVYYDRNLEASSRFKINSLPAIMVLDTDSRIQFSRALSDDGWKKDLVAVLNRVSQGEDLAAEMQQEYQHFLDSYHQEIETVSAKALIETSETTDSPGRSLSANPLKLNPVKAWSFNGAQSPGNVQFLGGDSPRFLLFDGWQTILELDSSGSLTHREKLALPENVAVSILRAGQIGGQTLYGVASALGKRIYLFDKDWKPKGVYPRSEQAPIWDFAFLDANQDLTSEMVVSFDGNRGLELVDTTKLESESIRNASPKSLVAYGAEEILVAENGKIKLIRAGISNQKQTELGFQRVRSRQGRQICGLGVSRTGEWKAIGLDTNLVSQWTIAIGPQYFENEIEPLVSEVTSTGNIIWAIADSENVIHLVSESGKWLGDFQSESAIRGIELATIRRQTHMIVVNDEGVHCWNLNLHTPMMPASHQK